MTQLSPDKKKRFQQFIAIIKKAREGGKTYEQTVQTLINLTKNETRDRNSLPKSFGMLTMASDGNLLEDLRIMRKEGQSIEQLVNEAQLRDQSEEIAILSAWKAEMMHLVKVEIIERKRRSLAQQGLAGMVIGIISIGVGVGAVVAINRVWLLPFGAGGVAFFAGLGRWIQSRSVK